MKTERVFTIVPFVIVAVLFYLFYKILSPFLSTLAWAMVLSITFYPAYGLCMRFVKRPWLSSLAILVLILILITGPFTYIVSALVNEITSTLSGMEDRGFDAITKITEEPKVKAVIDMINSFFAPENFDLKKTAVDSLRSVGKYIIEHISGVFTNMFLFAVNFIIMCFTIFFFLKDGERLVDYLKKLLPFTGEQKKKLETTVKGMVIAAIYGGVAVGIAQGILGGLAFLIFGLPSPVFWGAAMAVFSLVPLFGTFVIWGPAALFLILGGSYAKGIGLILYGILIISTVDNLLKPLIIGSRTKLHTLLIFFSVLGGIKFFGFLGFILGPLIAALCLSLLEMYSAEEGETSGTSPG